MKYIGMSYSVCNRHKPGQLGFVVCANYGEFPFGLSTHDLKNEGKSCSLKVQASCISSGELYLVMEVCRAYEEAL